MPRSESHPPPTSVPSGPHAIGTRTHRRPSYGRIEYRRSPQPEPSRTAGIVRPFRTFGYGVSGFLPVGASSSGNRPSRSPASSPPRCPDQLPPSRPAPFPVPAWPRPPPAAARRPPPPSGGGGPGSLSIPYAVPGRCCARVRAVSTSGGAPGISAGRGRAAVSWYSRLIVRAWASGPRPERRTR
jgi:hypothetical protein